MTTDTAPTGHTLRLLELLMDWSKQIQMKAGIETQMLVANLIIPEYEATTPFFKNRRSMQEKYLIEIKNTFNRSKILKVPMYDREVKGLKMLREIGENIF